MDKKINCQIKHEINSWLRLIEFFRQENALLKYRLSELVDNIDGSNFLQTAEYFQNEFLSKDEALKKLIKEIQNYSDYIEDQKKFPSQLLKNHNALRKNIHEFEENYIFLSEEFNKRMFKVITA